MSANNATVDLFPDGTRCMPMVQSVVSALDGAADAGKITHEDKLTVLLSAAALLLARCEGAERARLLQLVPRLLPAATEAFVRGDHVIDLPTERLH